MNVDQHGVIWTAAKDVVPGDVLANSAGAKVLAVSIIAGAFVKITYEWGSDGKSMFPGLNQRVALRSVNVE